MLDTAPAPRRFWQRHLVPVLAGALLTGLVQAQGPARLLAWNDLGMHCMDNDTSVFSILPPFNTFHAQLLIGGHIVTSGYTVTYEAVADPNGSINSTSAGKTDFWLHVGALFGANPPVDTGLAGFSMPGTANVPQNMPFQSGLNDFLATGVPMTPYDDNMVMNPYPLLKLVARNAAGQVVASTTPVIPVSAEMACTQCHGSGGSPDARPAGGWVYGPAATDDRLNILKLHDDHHQGSPVFAAAATAVGYSTSGLYVTATTNSTPVLCAACHGSNALSAPGQPGAGAMTSVMHTKHGQARLPDGRRLDDVQDRSSCYTCHPGARTRCLRGAMGKAIGADGLEMMSCQDCHGSMSEVGNPARTGWLQEPSCQNCHTGDAVSNAGAIRFDNAYSAPGVLRPTTNARFATTPNSPQTGFNLYRFSAGHGGMECSACHGSPHAIWPASEDNDNLQSISAQGHKGTLVECSSCHSNLQDTQWVGPHGMHPTGNTWAHNHADAAEQQGVAACRVCHGTDGRGTVLSRSQGDRTISTQFGARTFWRGYEVGCYECHNGPNSESQSNNTAPTVTDLTTSTPTDTPLPLTLSATDPNPDVLTLRIVSQPRHGAVAFDGTHAVYRAWDGYVGTDSFTYAASDTKRNSNLGTVTIAVGTAACGSSHTFGFGCALADGSVPSIHVDGCALSGQVLDFVVDNVPSSGFGILALGVGRGAIELDGGGCALRTQTLLGTTDLLPVLNGAMHYQVQVPVGLGNWAFVMQGFCLTTAAPRGFVASAGLEVTLP